LEENEFDVFLIKRPSVFLPASTTVVHKNTSVMQGSSYVRK